MVTQRTDQPRPEQYRARAYRRCYTWKSSVVSIGVGPALRLRDTRPATLRHRLPRSTDIATAVTVQPVAHRRPSCRWVSIRCCAATQPALAHAGRVAASRRIETRVEQRVRTWLNCYRQPSQREQRVSFRPVHVVIPWGSAPQPDHRHSQPRRVSRPVAGLWQHC